MPTFLSIVVGPVFVIEGVPARMEKAPAVPRPTVVVAAFGVRPAAAPIAMTSAMPSITTSLCEFFIQGGSLFTRASLRRVYLRWMVDRAVVRSDEHTSELHSP